MKQPATLAFLAALLFASTGSALGQDAALYRAARQAPPADETDRQLLRKDGVRKVGAGLGLRWRSPVGMVRVDLGTPISDTFASGVELHIIIGPDL